MRNSGWDETSEAASYVCEMARHPSAMADVLCINEEEVTNEAEDDIRLESRLPVCHASIGRLIRDLQS